jgi:hypothetical protein
LKNPTEVSLTCFAQTDPSFEERVTAHSVKMGKDLEERLSSRRTMTDAERELLAEISTFVADRVGTSLIPGEGDGHTLLERRHMAFRGPSKGCRAEQAKQLRRDMFLELQSELDSLDSI